MIPSSLDPAIFSTFLDDVQALVSVSQDLSSLSLLVAPAYSLAWLVSPGLVPKARNSLQTAYPSYLCNT